MSRAFEEDLIRHCAATLAGHKCASLFSCRAPSQKWLKDNIDSANAALSGKGLRACLVRNCERGALVYVYRVGALEKKLAEPAVRAFLTGYGYEDFSIESALGTLARHMICGESFPHEIGVFLDYPLADVAAFIENEGRNCRCVGCWKAYSNIDEARRLFALYRKCRDVYMACYQRGFGVARLTVAA